MSRRPAAAQAIAGLGRGHWILSPFRALLVLLLAALTSPATASWKALNSGTTNDLRAVHFPVDANTGWAVGALGTILKTTDGGTTWTPQTPANPGANFYDVHFVDENTGYAVGILVIEKTTDGGANWISQGPPSNQLRTVHFPVDATTGYAAGSGGLVQKTTDGGLNWVASSWGTTLTIESIYFPVDATTGYAVGSSGEIRKTTDGGGTWTPQTSGAPAILRGVHFPVDTTTGYVVGRDWYLGKTTDGGANWILQVPGTQMLTSVHFPVDPTTGWVSALGPLSTIRKTTDGGATWIGQSVPTTADLEDIYFVDATTGYAVGAGGTILKTTDGGGTQVALHPTSDGSTKSFSIAPTGCLVAEHFDCVNDQPLNAPSGAAVANDGSSSSLKDGNGGTGREMFNLADAQVPAGSLIRAIEVFASVAKGTGATPGVRLSYQLPPAAPVDSGSSFTLSSTTCCDQQINYPWQGLAWSTADLDNLQIGIVHESGGQVEVSQIYVVVSYEVSTAVELLSFEAFGVDRAVELTWETGSEIGNLGFHLYRSLSEQGPYQPITATPIPGLGSSPEGARYRYVDSGLTNGVTYYYQLEDIETTGTTKLHGPVWAMPSAPVVTEGEGEGSGWEEESGDSTSRITYGDPEANELKVRRRGQGGLELELITEGFYAIPQDDGTVLLEIPGFEDFGESGAPDVPVYRTWQDVVAGGLVTLGSVRVDGLAEFSSLRPSSSELIVVAREDGTVQPGRRRAERRGIDAFYPESWAQLLEVGYQGSVKKALVEMAPVRWDARRERLLLARRVVVRLSFSGRDREERRHREVGSHADRQVLARLAVREPGLYGVSHESLYRMLGKRSVPTSELRLSRQGEPVAFFLSPSREEFGRRSTLYFVSEGASLNPYGQEAVYELELSPDGVQMQGVNGSPAGAPTSFYWKTVKREKNLLYQSGFEGEESIWQWDWLFGPMTKGFSFEVKQLSPAPENPQLRVWLHGASAFPANPDHHVRLYVNGVLVTETWWDGKKSHRVEAELGPGVLREGANTLGVEEVGDTAAAYSMVMLDRFEVSYPAELIADTEGLEGSFSESGTARVSGLQDNTVVLDTTGAQPGRLWGTSVFEGGVSYRAESGHSYLAVSGGSVKSPELRAPQSSDLKSVWNRAEYLVIGPRSFLAAAEPLLAHRRNEGLVARSVATEQIYEEFGYGEATPESIRDFLSYVYHHWGEPTLRYVVLLGDGTYDTKDYLATGVQSYVPIKNVKTSYLWTASDPWYGAIHGEDLLPDVAIGRLPAASVEEVELLVEKILAYETGERDPAAPFVLITDNPDMAGNFDADAEEIASTVLSEKVVEKIYLSELGTARARSAIIQAFEDGASLISYMGHGGIHLWANENLLNIWQVDSLAPQSQQALLFTMNCLNGYFHFPYFNALSEELLKAEGKGIIAAFSPTGLSLNEPAHRFHKALLEEIVNQPHERLGDAVLAGQAAYAETGAFPELLSIYHLLGDPALRLR